jgi:hypothetical protein
MNDVFAFAIVTIALVYIGGYFTLKGVCHEAEQKHYVLDHCQ